MLKKIGIVMAVAAAMAVATAPAAMAHGKYPYDYDYKIVVKEGGYHGYGQGHYYKDIRISRCSVGGSSSASGSIYTMTNSDSCSTYYKHKHYRGNGPS